MSVVPSSAADRQKLKALLVEVTNCLSRIDAEKDQMKSILEDAEEKFGIKKKLIGKIARTMYKSDYSSLQQENDDFTSLYEILVEGKKADKEAA